MESVPLKVGIKKVNNMYEPKNKSPVMVNFLKVKYTRKERLFTTIGRILVYLHLNEITKL